MTLDEAIERIQFAYPQIYYACHTRHERRKSNTLTLSARDSEMLVHLDRARPTLLTALARHMDLSLSTVSEAISKLEAFGYVHKSRLAGGDGRKRGLVLSSKGVAAVRAASVLEARKLRAALGGLLPREITAAVSGLAKLAEACRSMPAKRRRSE